ncbi:ATP binding [Ascochyta rabiei]|uniref:Serine/threonine-protein kinase Tel1 n=1 Tax=Didymella rabiei TaxID=5454 RepID=A0A163A5G8_DIDRA|nr:ATP binding [Ascochyta rabiei]
MGATNIQDAKILIQSPRSKERTAGLKDLILILKHNRGKPSLEALGNKAYLALCETLFQCLRDERSSFLQGKSNTPKTQANFLRSATSLRLVIASGVRTIKSSTVEVIIDTIIEVLPGTDGLLLKPLLEDLPKTLRLLLEYQPHVERLSVDCWDAAVDFCIDSLAGFSTEAEAEALSSWSTNVSSRGRTPFHSTEVSIARGSTREPVQRTKSVTDEFAHSTENFIHCLLALVKATNAPVLDKAEAILTALLHFLSRRTGRGSVAAAALAGINAILARIALQSLDLSKRIIKGLLPLIKPMWSEHILRDEILITLTYTEAHISSLVADLEDTTTCLDLEAVLEAMYADYRTRKETTAHQYLEEDHLCFRHLGASGADTHPLHTLVFSMETEHAKSEGLWATVYAIARFSSMLDKRKRKTASEREVGGESVFKRARIDLLFDEYTRHIAEPRSNAKRAALQVVAFSVQEGPVDEDKLQSLLEKLTSCMADENVAHSVWAMIGLAATAFQISAKHPTLTSYWVSIWQSASRAVTSPSLCRAACHLMDVLLKLGIVPFAAVSDIVQSMLLSIELTVIRERVKENPTHFNQTAERIVSWLFNKWTPSLWSERTYAAINAHHSNARDVLQMLYACLDTASSLPEPLPLLVLGSVSQARVWNTRYRTLAQYLLLLNDDDKYLAQMTVHFGSSQEAVVERQPTNTDIRVLDFCQSEVDRARERWKDVAQSNAQNITSSMMRIVTNLCIVAPAIASLSNPRERRVAALESSTNKLVHAFVSTLSKLQTEQYKIDAVLETCTKSLPDLSSYDKLDPKIFKQTGVSILSQHLSKALGDRQEVKQSFYAEDEDDFMDIDEGEDSQMTTNSTNPENDVPRQADQAETDTAALRASSSSYLHFITAVFETTDRSDRQIPSRFVDYLISLNENELLRSRQFIRSLLHSGLELSRTDCLNLLERLSDALAAPRAREYNTSEVANGMLVEVLIGTALVWGPDDKDPEAKLLYENVEDMYTYYVKGLEKNGIRRSSSLQEVIAVFLHGLLKHHPSLGQDPKVPSVRTSLFELLSRSEITIKYHIAERLPSMFEEFVLSEHDKILQDVDSSLPGEDDGLEGIAVRLLVLSKLASRWHTLLRSSIYRIFATAGSVKQAAQHAQRCILKVAESRGFASSQHLFQLFAPQILFTWLDRGNKIASIPFLTFDYSTLVDLIEDVEAEAVGQAIMFGRQDEVEYLAKQLNTATTDLLGKNIGKAAAYTISWDICRGFARNKAEPSYANLLKELMGSDQYFHLVQKRFPQVLACILQTIDQEERVGRSLEKKPAFTPAAKTLTEMINISHSPQDLNTGIEPSFNAFYLPDQLERLCRRTGDDPVGFWTSSTYTFVMRALLDRIHPALGSLYARSMIRKIRIVIALAGPVAYEGYPLQMTLQSLRPFLTDVQCAEDTVGIMQHLFERGSQYLRQHLNFVTGIGLSILISIRVFLGTAQDSTTQQSQHIATMTTANKFHNWLTEYLKSHAEVISLSERSSSVKAFKLITTAASQVRAEGNSIRGSEESTLLVEILNDVRSGRKLLNKTSREVALNLLCQNFQLAPTARDDILGKDQDAADYAGLVWESCRRANVGEGYLLWAARVLGRAFSAHGEIKQSIPVSRRLIPSGQNPKDSLGRISRETIIQEVVDLFYSDERNEVSLAENAVRYLIARLPKGDRQYEAEVYNAIPDAIGKALILYIPDPSVSALIASSEVLKIAAAPTEDKSVAVWVRNLAVALCAVASEDPILGALPALLHGIKHLAEKLFPYILHLVLLAEYEEERSVREAISTATMSWFCDCGPERAPYVRIIIQAILYLRSQPVPKEITRVDRDRWLDIDYLEASQAATACSMYRSALLFAETSSGQPVVKSASRRSSVLAPPPGLPTDLQLAIYKNLDEPDSFYGIDRGSNLSAVLDRLDYEEDGVKSLIFRSARLDSQMRRRNELELSDIRGTVRSLIMLNMNSVTHSLLLNDQFRHTGDDVVESTLHTARKLGQWDIKAPETNHTESATLFKAFQGLYFAKTPEQARNNFDQQMFATMNFLTGRNTSSVPTKTRLRTLAALTEADEVLRADNPEYLLDVWDRMKARERWMRAGEFTDVRQLLSCRETLFSVLSGNNAMIDSLHTRTATIRNMEVEALVSSSSISRRHGAIQESLASVTYLSDIVPKCKSAGLDIEATAQHEVANVLWEQGETDVSIRMRQSLIDHASFDSQNVELSLPVLLAKLGHHLAEARLAKPDAIMQEYLEPAIRELKGQEQGAGPGQVFHEFALFCDKQLQSPEAAEDLERIKTVMERKLQEYHDFIKLSKTDKSKGMRDTYQRSARRAKNWYELDHTEYERMRKGREQFLRQCLENYLLSLAASDEYNNDALRVFALWIEYADTDLANEAVKLYLSKVPSGKFALLMNQLSSRLQAESTDFQKLLLGLVFRICIEHPYHGMHQIFAIQMKVGPITREDVARAKDESARSRQKAAAEIANALRNDKQSRSYWSSIYQSNEIYHNLAMFKGEKESTQQGRELPLDRYSESKELVRSIPRLNVPPATLQVEVRPNMDYTDLPRIQRFKSNMSIANGLSAPKIITAIGTDGKPYKQLFKSGNDDLRQDAIMEQVFDQVSRLLKNHTSTRIRNIGIRTYKVLPLSTRSGLMEFVPNTVPLHTWVMPAHERYYPNDYKSDRCRKEIGACQADSLSTRVKVWKKVTENFHPVMRYFLLERFEDPDEWFERRLAYTRSTAAISILGHVLGLGDRHCHNILLDEKSGEVVHIDLGVSFEAGRVLPIPEVVPFRLTRDLVDAMGYTRTEGVFRRSCEFTMDTLREERESIMTLLNVLRYDPLVNWSVTPTKAKRMQEGDATNNTARGQSVVPGGTPAPSGQPGAAEEVLHESLKKKEKEEQAGEAGRALSVVEKKLSKTLSTKATVNELIQQATDERNLAVLYMGWASYA